MRRIRSVSALCAFCSVTVSVVGAGAEPPAVRRAAVPAATPNLEEPEAVAKAHARLLFEKGASAYRDGHFYEAVDIFLETNRLYPDPKLSFNIGKAFEGLGNQSAALRYYREYLRRLPGAPDKQEVDGHVEQLELSLGQKGIQQLTIITTPDGATLKLDGQAVGVTPWTGESFAGKHRVVVEAAGYRPSERVIEVELHRAQDFNFELSLLPQAAAPRLPADPAQNSAKPSALTWAAIASGVALLGTALVAQALSSGDSRGTTRTSAFLAGSGAGVSVLGGLMLYFDLSPAHGSTSSVISWDGPGLEHSR